MSIETRPTGTGTKIDIVTTNHRQTSNSARDVDFVVVKSVEGGKHIGSDGERCQVGLSCTAESPFMLP